MIDNTKIIAEKVAARLKKYGVYNYPRSGKFNPQAFSQSYQGKKGEFGRRQREHEIGLESPMGQTLLAEHHITEALNKTAYYLGQWYLNSEKSDFDTAQDACRIIKHLESAIFERLSPAFVGLDALDPQNTVRAIYTPLKNSLDDGIQAVDLRCSKGKGKYAKRLKEYAPIAKQYLEGVKSLCETLKTECFKTQQIAAISN